MELNRLSKGLELLMRDNLISYFSKLRVEVIEIIMDDYNLMLNGVDIDRESKIKPEYYQDEFFDRLEFFDYIIEEDNKVSFRVPDSTTINLTDLDVLGLIFEGVSGKYVTVTEKQFLIASLKIGSMHPVDSNARKQDWVYLVRFNSSTRVKLERFLSAGKRLPLYAFSNSPPIDVFDDAEFDN